MKSFRFHIALELVLAALAVLLMPYAALPDWFHETAGIALFALAVLHVAVSRKFVAALFRRPISPIKLFRAFTALGIALCVLLQALSGILISARLFAFLPATGLTGTARELHMLLAYWTLVFAALHAGERWSLFLPRFARRGRAKIALFCVWGGVALYGVRAFVKRDALSFMLKKSGFAFFDYDEPALRALLDWGSVFLAFAALGAVLAWLCGPLQKKKEASSQT